MQHIEAGQQLRQGFAQAAVDALKGLDEKRYTADSWAVFKNALDAAQAVLNKEGASDQEYTDALAALDAAYKGLVEKETPTVPSKPGSGNAGGSGSGGNGGVSGGDGNTDGSALLSGAGSYAAQYNAVLEQYDMLVNDCSYKGINLLKGDMLSVVFNEDRSSGLNVMGRDISSSSLGLSRAEWQTVADISAAAADLQRVVNSLRSLNAELGNNYSIIQNRQDFTENLINVLTEGADKLTLADMNAESANMLALQTRQQLAVNSLSLSSEAARGVLLLFS